MLAGGPLTHVIILSFKDSEILYPEINPNYPWSGRFPGIFSLYHAWAEHNTETFEEAPLVKDSSAQIDAHVSSTSCAKEQEK